ncbi:MAG: ABC transporter permease [Candidatus Schekmanbacteria bacterium]|nr:ABC transporter permease [Candidatus Schekmanbacteria bacterium]
MFSQIIKHKLALFGLIIIVLMVFAALLSPVLAPYPPHRQDLSQGLTPPGPGHILGRDKLGRDICSRLIFGARISLLVGVVTVGICSLAGICIGAVAGYFGGLLDEIIMRLIDILLAFPGILLAIALMAVLGPGLQNVISALCLIGWIGYARLVRGEVLSLKEREFITAAKAQGLGNARIIFRHILPNIMAPVIVQISFSLAGTIVAEAGLSFLGLGVQPPTPSWGAMLNEGRQFMLLAPHISIFPGIAIMLVVLSFNFIGDALRDVLDPKRKDV